MDKTLANPLVAPRTEDHDLLGLVVRQVSRLAALVSRETCGPQWAGDGGRYKIELTHLEHGLETSAVLQSAHAARGCGSLKLVIGLPSANGKRDLRSSQASLGERRTT
jgi:hypothetical protein